MAVSETQYDGLRDPLATDHCPWCHALRKPLTHLARGHVDPFCSTACCKAWYRVLNPTEQLADFDQRLGNPYKRISRKPRRDHWAEKVA